MAHFNLKRILLPVAIIATGLMVLLLLFATKPSPQATPSQEQEWAITTQTVHLGTHQPNLQLYGTVESPRHSILKTALEADVLEKHVDEGDSVIEDQLLLALDNRDAKLIYVQRLAEVKSLNAQIDAEHVRYETDQKAIAQEKELIALTEKEVERRTRLFKSQTGSALDLDNARKALANQRLQLTNRERAISDHTNRLAQLKAEQEKAQAIADQAALDVERSQVTAPFAGKVAKLFVAVGNRVRPGDSLVEIFDSRDLEVRAQIPQQYLSDIRQALKQKQSLTAQAPVLGTLVEMKLDRLASKVESGRSGVDGLFMVTSHANTLEIGKTVAVFLKLRPVNDSIALPTQALYGLDRVYKVQQGRLLAINIQRLGNLINQDGSQSILVSSPELSEGDHIMTTQLPNAISGLKVRIKQQKES